MVVFMVVSRFIVLSDWRRFQSKSDIRLKEPAVDNTGIRT
jgi:hypothetical protein